MPEPLFEDRTPRLNLPLLFAGQSQKEFFVNEALARLDALVHCAVEAELPSPPPAPLDGQCWLVGPSATGTWLGQTGAIACFEQGQWLFQPPRDGLRLFNRATGQQAHYHGVWHVPTKPGLPTGGAVVDTEARAAVCAIIDSLVTAGILAQP